MSELRNPKCVGQIIWETVTGKQQKNLVCSIVHTVQWTAKKDQTETFNQPQAIQETRVTLKNSPPSITALKYHFQSQNMHIT